MKGSDRDCETTASSTNGDDAAPRPVGLQTAGRDIWAMVEKATHRKRNKSGAEKLDLLKWLAEDVQESIEHGKKMELELVELITFLKKEGMAPSSEVASAIEELLSLRRREMERLEYGVGKDREVDRIASQDDIFMKSVVRRKSNADLEQCFAMVVVPDPVPDED